MDEKEEDAEDQIIETINGLSQTLKILAIIGGALLVAGTLWAPFISMGLGALLFGLINKIEQLRITHMFPEAARKQLNEKVSLSEEVWDTYLNKRNKKQEES